MHKDLPVDISVGPPLLCLQATEMFDSKPDDQSPLASVLLAVKRLTHDMINLDSKVNRMMQSMHLPTDASAARSAPTPSTPCKSLSLD